MDIQALWRLLMRRWYVVAIVMGASVGGGLALASQVEPDYEVTGAVLFLGPAVEEVPTETGSEEETVNPLLTFSGSLGQVSEALGLRLQSQNVREQFFDRGLEPGYEVGADSRSPIMQFRVESANSENAAATVGALMTWIEDELDSRQASFDLGADDLISVQRLSEDNRPTPGFTNQRRAQLLVIASSIMLTILVAAFVDWLILRRGRRKTALDRLAELRGVGAPVDEVGVDDTDPKGLKRHNRESLHRDHDTALSFSGTGSSSPGSEDPSDVDRSEPASQI